MAIKTFKDYPNTETPLDAENLNEISNSVLTGWNSAGETWTYASVDDPTGVIYATGDVTGKYSLGMRIKFTNNSNTIYGIITALSSYDSGNDRTSITFLHEINPSNSQALYLMQNSAITNVNYSTTKAPFGFPLNPDKWSIKGIKTETSFLNNSGYTTIDSLSLPVGLWRLNCKLMLGQEVTGQVNTTGGWSTSASTFSDNNLKLFGTVESSGRIFKMYTAIPVVLNNPTKQTWYWIWQVSYGKPTIIENTATIVPSQYAFECAYL